VDTPLARHARERTPSSFAEVVRFYQAPVYNTALRILGDAAAAEDVAQSVFLSLLEGGTPEGISSERAWVHRVAVNAALQWLRAEKSLRARQRAAFTTEAVGSGQESVRKELADLALEELQSLPEDLRIAVTLRCLQGLTYAEVSSAAGVPIGTAAGRVRSGLEQLRSRLLALGAVLGVVSLEDALAAVPPAPVPPTLSGNLASMPLLVASGPAPLAAPLAGAVLSSGLKTAAAAILILGAGFLAGYALRLQPPPLSIQKTPAVIPAPETDVAEWAARLKDSEARVEMLRKEITEQDLRRQSLEARLTKALSIPPAPQPNPDAAKVALTGKVTGVKDWTVMINLGGDDGVKEGDVFFIHGTSTQVARAVLRELLAERTKIEGGFMVTEEKGEVEEDPITLGTLRIENVWNDEASGTWMPNVSKVPALEVGDVITLTR